MFGREKGLNKIKNVGLAVLVVLSLVGVASAGDLDVNVTDYEPTEISHTVDSTWINFTWSTTDVNSTDGFNATITDCSNSSLVGNWYNVSNGTGDVDYATDQMDAYLNVTGLQSFQQASIEVWAYNESAGLSANSSTDSAFTQATSINSVDLPDQFTPGVNNTITVNVTDSMNDGDEAWVKLHIYRNDTTWDASGDAKTHYTLTYELHADNYNGSISVNPPYSTSTLTDAMAPLNEITPNMTLEWKPPHYIKPSYGTDNQTLNNYHWEVRANFTVSGDVTETMWNNSTTEMTALKSMDMNASSLTLDEQAVPGNTYSLTPPITIRNTGNVPVDINKSMSDLTSDTGTITASNLYLDDDSSHNETTETGLPEQAYSNTLELWGVSFSITELTDADSNVIESFSRPCCDYDGDLPPTKVSDVPITIDKAKISADYDFASHGNNHVNYCYVSDDGETWREVDADIGSVGDGHLEVILPNKPEAKYLELNMQYEYTNWGYTWDVHSSTIPKTIETHNFIEIPSGAEAGHYTGTWTLSAVENWS